MVLKPFVAIALSIALVLFSSTFTVADIERDDRMTLPFDLIQGKSGVFQGVDYALLNTANAFLASPFSQNYMSSSAKTTKPRWQAGFDFEEIESIRELTEKSSFAARASYKSPMFKVAASINKQRETEIKEIFLRQYAFTRYETRVSRVNYDPKLSSTSFRPDVIGMRRELDAALAKQDFAEAAAIRSKFRSAYGTGFIQSVTEGGMFFLLNSRNFNSKAERDQYRLSVSGSGGGSLAGADKDNQRRQLLTSRFKNVRGKFIGGEYHIADATWEEFLKIAPKWAASVLQRTEILSADYVPYYRIDYLHPLTTAPYLKPSPNTAILGYYGTPDRPHNGMIVSLQGDDSRIQFGTVPMLTPVAAHIEGTKLRLLVTVDPALVKSSQIDLATKWSELKPKQPGTLGKAIQTVAEPTYLEDAFVWPTLRVSASPGAEPIVIHPTRDPLEIPVQTLVIDQTAAMASSRTEIQMNGWYEFDFSVIGKPVRGLLEDKLVTISTHLTLDFIETLESDARVMEVSGTDKVTQNIRFKFPGVPLVSDQVRFTTDVEDAIRTRIKAALEGPPKKTVPIPAGKTPLMTRSKWDSGRRYNDYLCRTMAKHGFEYPLDQKTPPGMQLVGTSVIDVRGGWSTAGGCEKPGDCNGPGEECQTWYNVQPGCYVNKDWYDWFMSTVNRYNLGSLTTAEFICRR